MNLDGFCGADNAVCNPPGPSPSGDPTAAQLKTSSAAGQAAQIVASVGQYLVGFAARVGKQYVCPALPTLGAVAGETVAIAFLPEEIPIIGPTGAVALTLTAAEFGKIIGRQAGADLQSTLCG